MTKLISAAKSFHKGEEAATMVEYALMVALVAIVCIATITTMAGSLKGTFTAISTALTAAAG